MGNPTQSLQGLKTVLGFMGLEADAVQHDDQHIANGLVILDDAAFGR